MACLSASKYVSLAISQKIKWHGRESLRDKQESVNLRLQHRTRGKCRGTCYSTFATVPSPSRPSLPHPTHHYHQQCFHSAPRQQRSTWAGAAVTIPAGLERPAENALLKPMFWSNIGSPSGGQSWHRRGCSWQSNLESGVLWALKIFLRRGRKWARGYSNLNSPGNDNARSSSPTNQGPFVPSKHLKLPVPTGSPISGLSISDQEYVTAPTRLLCSLLLVPSAFPSPGPGAPPGWRSSPSFSLYPCTGYTWLGLPP